MSKPNLFCFGDSFVQWPEPVGKHWTNLFENEYKVHRLGNNGASNEHIIFQLGNLPKYAEGDRVVIVLTDYIRIPKWEWGEHYGEFTESNPNKPAGSIGFSSLSKTVRVLEEVMIRKQELLEKVRYEGYNVIKRNSHGRDNPGELYNFIDNIENILGLYRPVVVTWNEQTYKMLKNKITPILRGTWSSLSDEGIIDGDYHPGIEGCEYWYKVIRASLQRNNLI